MTKKIFTAGLFTCLLVITSCSDDPSSPKEPDPPEELEGTVLEVVAPDVEIATSAEKISQLVGDYDRHVEEPTQNQTDSRYGFWATDLGVPFQDGERTWIAFGDTWGQVGGERDVMAYTTDSNPEDGLALDFIEDDEGVYDPISIPDITQEAFEVPAEGVMVDDEMYLYHTTDHDPNGATMGRSVLARQQSEGSADFEFLYDFSTSNFINLSIVKASSSDWDLLPESEGKGLVMFGSGTYRDSEVYLAYQPASEIEDPDAIQYFAGVDEDEGPLWEADESDALPVFELDSPCIGEFSVSHNNFIDRWIMLYNCGDPRGINMRTAEFPWGPWTETQIIFEPWEDDGYCHFMHVNWEEQECDNVHDDGRENEWGGEYGPYQFEHFATGDDGSTTIYFTMSTWNPYTVVLMKAQLQSSE